MGLFGKSRFLDADIEDWTLETWAWLMANLGGMERLRRAPLALANKDFFPPTETEGDARAAYVFDQVKALMGLADWPCRLEPHDRLEAVQRVGYYAALERDSTANGTFRIENGEVVISYARDLVADPRHLIATFAHELSHYLLASIRKPIPGGMKLHELATELTVAYAGFGVFAANRAFQFQQHQDPFGQGWRTARNGYFSEPTWALAIALFTTLKGIEVPRGQLKDSVAVLTGRATRYLKRNPALLEPLQAIG